MILVAGAATPGDRPALLRVDRPAEGGRNQLIEAGVPLVAELSNAFLALGDPTAIVNATTELGLGLEVIDPAPMVSAYALAGLRPGGTLADSARCGEVIWKEDDWILLRSPLLDLDVCVGNPAISVTPLSLEPLGPATPPPPGYVNFAKGMPELLDTDPLVVDMLTRVDTGFAMFHWEGVVGWASTRYSTSAGCQTAAEQVHALFDAYGLEPEYQHHTGGHAPTVIGTIIGRINPEHVFIVIGHLDDMPSSGPAPGADDNASGTAMVTALADIMSAYDFASTIRFLAVTGEEWGLYGSSYYVGQAAAAGEDIQAVLNADMIGWEGDGSPDPEDMDINYNTSSAWLGNLMVQVAADYPVGIPVNAFQCNDMAYSDHWPFWQEGWSAILGITDNEGFCGQQGHYPHHHTSSDTIANCGPGAPAFEAAAIRLYLAAAGHLADPLCVRTNPPTGVTAQSAGDNRIDLSWASAGPGLGYEIRRAPGGCSAPGPVTVVGETTNLIFSDNTASGGVLYGYTVHAKDPSGYCTSEPSACIEVSTSGICTEPPNFAGADGVVNSATETCRLTVNWSPPSEVYCGDNVAYNVYRSTSAGFDPSPANRIATLVAGTAYEDLDVVFDEFYHYIVRAVDQSNGTEDGNTTEVAGSPTGPSSIGTWLDDAGDSNPTTLALETPWHTATSGGYTGPQVYQTGPYSSNTCAAATTPLLWLGPSTSLEFWSRYDIEDGRDKGIVEISANGGSSWARLEVGYPGSAKNTGDQCGLPTGTYFTGVDTSYDAYTASLAQWNGQQVMLRWRLSSDSDVEASGWWIDDISITDVSVPGQCTTVTPRVFTDGFESGDTTAWSSVAR